MLNSIVTTVCSTSCKKDASSYHGLVSRKRVKDRQLEEEMPCALCVCWINLTRSRWNAVFVICWRESGRADCSEQAAVAVHWNERSWKTKLVFKRSLPRTLLHPPLKFRHHVTHAPNLPVRHYSHSLWEQGTYSLPSPAFLLSTPYQYKPFIFLWQSLPNQQRDPTHNELCPIKFTQLNTIG